MKQALCVVIGLALSACTLDETRVVERAAPAAVDAARPNSDLTRPILWFKTSAERKAAFEQTYRVATDRLTPLIGDRAAGTWAVVLDADETVIDNTEYQLRLARSTRPFDARDWNGWASEKSAPVLPGAAQFIRTVRERGGKAIIVTNREEAVCADTAENFVRLGIAVDGILCKRDGVRDKNPRFASIADGTSGLGLPPLAIVAYVGDNIQDFPERTQANPGGFEDFGRSQFVLPNPMYGSWEQNVLEAPDRN